VDELSRRALIRSVTAFLVVLVVGSVAISLVGRATGPTRSASSPSPSSPSTSSGPSTAATPRAWLAWVPGGLPDGFDRALSSVAGVTSPTTIATADIAWMTQATNPKGKVVDSPTEPYMTPIDTTGVDPTFAAFLPESQRRTVASLKPGQGILSQTAAKLRGMRKPGGTLTFDTGASVNIVATLPDVLMGGYELLVPRRTGVSIGVTHERYALFTVAPNANPVPVTLAARFVPYLPADAPYPDVEVRAPGDTAYLRADDGELPLALLKSKFGEFTAYPSTTSPGALEIDRTWIQDHIESAAVPVLGSVMCNTDAIRLLKKAMAFLTASGDESAITDVGACYKPVYQVDGPGPPISAQTFGAAIELNPQSNVKGQPPSQSTKLVKAMARAGFGWGGDDAYPQGALFRYDTIRG
jgi:hypothetical protein